MTKLSTLAEDLAELEASRQIYVAPDGCCTLSYNPYTDTLDNRGSRVKSEECKTLSAVTSV